MTPRVADQNPILKEEDRKDLRRAGVGEVILLAAPPPSLIERTNKTSIVELDTHTTPPILGEYPGIHQVVGKVWIVTGLRSPSSCVSPA